MGEKNLKMQILQASKPKVVKFWDYSWHKPVDCFPSLTFAADVLALELPLVQCRAPAPRVSTL